jgi:hypothetical protein
VFAPICAACILAVLLAALTPALDAVMLLCITHVTFFHPAAPGLTST